MTVTRSEFLRINLTLTAHILHYQDLKYNPRTSLLKEGEKIILDHNSEPVKLTKELADKLNKEDIDYFNHHKDTSPFRSTLNLGFISEIGLRSGKKTKVTYLNDLGETLENLRIFLRQEHLIILGEWPTPWLSQTNDYTPVQAALNYLSYKIDKYFTGGFQLKGSSTIEFIPHLFWLTRCNASLPDFRFAFTSSKTVFSLCKYGILHLDFYDEKERDTILNFFEQKGFSTIEFCSDPVDFDRI